MNKKLIKNQLEETLISLSDFIDYCNPTADLNINNDVGASWKTKKIIQDLYFNLKDVYFEFTKQKFIKDK